MKISSNYQYYPQFKSNNHLANLTKKIPNTNICKNMTYLDKNCLISYLHASKYRLRNCGEEIKNIYAHAKKLLHACIGGAIITPLRGE